MVLVIYGQNGRICSAGKHVESGKPSVVRFGVFEVDLEARELRKRGVRVKLQEQPLRLLEALLEQPGAIVSREEIQQRLWADDTFVDFDKSLNTAVQKVRLALGDSAESPRFVETIPRRGYRFVAPVDRAVAAAAPPGSRRLRLGLAVLAALAVLLLVGWRLRDRSASAPTPFTVRQLTFESGIARDPAISRDGGLLAYASDRANAGNFDIWVRQISGDVPVRLTEHPAHDLAPSFSPDGQLVAFYSTRDGGGLYVKPTLGGEARLLARGSVQTPRFSTDGRLITYTNYGPGVRIWAVPVEGGEPRQIHPDNPPLRTLFLTPPVWLPDGRMVTGSNRTESWMILDPSGPPSVRLEISEDWLAERGFARRLAAAATELYLVKPDAWWPGRDRIIFTATHGSSTNLWSIPISLEDGKIVGEPERLTSGAGPDLSPSASDDGRIVYTDLSANLDIVSVAIDPTTGAARGDFEPITADESKDTFPVVSSEGKRIAYISDSPDGRDVWVRDLETGQTRRVTFSGKQHWQGGVAFSPDGSQVAFREPEDGTYIVGAEGGKPIRVGDARGVRDWSPIGDKLHLNRDELDLKTGEVRSLIEGSAFDARVSPDGLWLAFHWFSAPDRRRIFIAPVHEDRAAREDERVAVTSGDGAYNEFRAAWAPDGNRLYFSSDRDGYACIWAQNLDPKTKRPIGAPFEVYGFHQTSPTPAGRSHGFWLSATRDRIYFNIRRSRGNIWLLDPVEESAH